MDEIKETLDWCNRERAARGIGGPLEVLPKGKRMSHDRCPVALALGGPGIVSVACDIRFYEYKFAGETDETFALPEFVHDFLAQFDNGDIPELIA